MYSVEEFLEQADQASDDDLERVVEDDDENEPREDEAEEATENKDEGSAKKVAKKVRKPSNRPKLDVERLKGPRGLASIEKLFTKVEFKGNGHEQEDLQAVMRTLHYWCHRLFPKYSFDDCLEHLERLGCKKPLITLKKKILFDLFEEDQPVVNDVEDPDTQEAINEFDLLLQQEPISTLSQRPVTPERIELTEEQKEMIERNRLLAAERRKARLEALQQKQAQILQNADSTANSSSSELTEEQKEIIERNRQLALERRRAKNNLNTSITSSMVPSSQELNSTVDTVNSQKSNQSVNFNELVDSFFPASNEDNTQKSDEDGVDINDLIEELNPTSEENPTEKNPIVKPVEVYQSNLQNNEDVNFDDLLLNNTKDINTTVIDPSSQQNEDATSTTKIDTIEDKMDVAENDKSDHLNLENSNLIEENPIVKYVETNVDIDPSNTELNQKNEDSASTTKIDTIEDKMDVTENDKSEHLNLENLNPREENPIVKSVETNVDIDPSNTELNQKNVDATSTTKKVRIEDKMDVADNEKSDNLNLENSYDINSTKEDTIANLLETE